MLQLSKLNWRKGLMALGVGLFLVAAVSGFFVWRRHEAAGSLADLKPAVYEPTQEVSGDLLPLPPAAPRKP